MFNVYDAVDCRGIIARSHDGWRATNYGEGGEHYQRNARPTPYQAAQDMWGQAGAEAAHNAVDGPFYRRKP